VETHLRRIIAPNPSLYVLLVLCFLVPFHVAAQTTRPRTAPPKITRIDVKAPKDLDVKMILAKSGLKVGDPLSKPALEEAKTKLSAAVAYETHLFLDDDSVRVSSTTQGRSAVVLIEVTIPVVKQIVIDGNGPIAAEDLVKKMTVKIGQTLSLKVLEADLATLEGAYTDAGYQADVKGEATFRNQVLTIPMLVSRIRNIKFIGLRRRTEQDLIDQMKSKPGLFYNSRTIREDMLSIGKSFREIEPKVTFPAEGVVDVQVTVADR